MELSEAGKLLKKENDKSKAYLEKTKHELLESSNARKDLNCLNNSLEESEILTSHFELWNGKKWEKAISIWVDGNEKDSKCYVSRNNTLVEFNMENLTKTIK